MKEGWQPRGLNRGTKWTAWILFLLLTSWMTLMTLWGWRMTRIKALLARNVATVDGKPITPGELAEELRARLWRDGETWSALSRDDQNASRKKAVENLINSRLIADFASRQSVNTSSLQRESGEEFQQFLNQFPPPDEWKERMELQGLDESALRGRISSEVNHLNAIESWLAQQPGKATEADARQWFNKHAKELVIPERIRASHIFLTRMADKDQTQNRELEIRELHRKITAGEATFEELASKNSDDESAKLRSGDLGWFSRDRVPPEFGEKVFALTVGETSSPLESHLGWHIVRVKEKQPLRAATFDEMKGEITAKHDHEWREASVKRLIAELRAKAKIELFDSRMSAIEP